MLVASCYLHLLLCESIPRGTIEQSGKGQSSESIADQLARTHAAATHEHIQMQQPVKIYAVFPSPFMPNTNSPGRSAVCSQHILLRIDRRQKIQPIISFPPSGILRAFAFLAFVLVQTKKILFPMGMASESAESASDRSLFLLSPKPSFLTGESLFFFLKPPICAPFILILNLSLSPGCRLGQSICRVHPSAGQSSTPAAVLNTSTNNNNF